MEHKGKSIWGIILIIFGVNLLIGNVINVWPLIIVAIGVYIFVRGNFGSGIFMVGLGGLLWASTIWGFELWAKFWPLVIILIGISSFFGDKRHGLKRSVETNGEISETVVLSGVDRVYKTNDFKGGEITAVLGGGEIDLSAVTISEDTTLEITVVLGGIKVILPKDCKTVVNGTAVLGGWEDKRTNRDSSGKTLTLTGVAVLGGVEIVNS
ncbi:hypothetical protein JW962_00865 [Candidatus Dojkabacteria bacterium]|nr:hypothetical protein [Candidatus Dojkabacteria bacterium]